MLFGTRSMFLKTGGSVAWLYHCPKFFSPLRVLDSFYDRNLILLERSTKFVDPVTLQTNEIAPEIPCLVDYTNVFHLDLEKDNSSFQFLHDHMPLLNFCCLNQINWDILASFLLSALSVLEFLFPSR